MNRTGRIEKGLVTIVVPAYNAEQFLCENVESIINQTYKDLEIIYVCDGCTDRTVEILAEYAKRDSRICIDVETQNHGAAISRNIGMNMATGDWIIFLDADDLFNACMIEEMIEAAVGAQADIAGCYRVSFDDTPDAEASFSYSQKMRKLYCKTYPIVETAKEQKCILQIVDKGPCTKLVHKSIYTKEEVFFQDVPNANDAYYSIVAAINSNRIVYVDKAFLYYRSNKGRHTLSTDRSEKKNYILEACNKVFKYIESCPNNESLLESFYNDVFFNLNIYMESKTYNVIFEMVRSVYLDAWKISGKDISEKLSHIGTIIYKSILNGRPVSNRQKLLMEARIDCIRKLAVHDCSIWGAGLLGADLLHEISGLDINIQHVYDSDQNKWGMRIGKYVIEEPEDINSDHIIVTTPKYYESIKTQIGDETKRIYNLESQIWMIP